MFTGTLPDDVSQHDLGPHPARRANGLHASVLQKDASICSWHQSGHVGRRLSVRWNQRSERFSFVVSCRPNPDHLFLRVAIRRSQLSMKY